MADFKKESREVRIDDHTIREGEPSDLTIKINADVADALTGFKALARELRETTKLAREYEAAMKNVEQTDDWRKVACDNITRILEGERTYYDLSGVPTEQLADELAKREGVKEYAINVEYGAKLSFNEHRTMVNIEGPARVLVSKDD